MPQPGGSGAMVVYDRVTVQTEDDSYENVVAIQGGNVLGIVPDPAKLEQEYGGSGGPGPERLFKRHSRYVVPWRRVIRIDRGGSNGPSPESDTSVGQSQAETGSGVDATADEREDDDSPDNVFDDV